MPSKLAAHWPRESQWRIVQHAGSPVDAQLAHCEQLLVVLPAKPAKSAWQVPDGARLQRLHQRQPDADCLTSRLHNKADTGITLGFVPNSAAGTRLPGRFELLSASGKFAAAALAENPATLGILAAGFGPEQAREVVTALLLALQAHSATLPGFQLKPKTPSRLRSVQVFGAGARLPLARILAEGRATNLVRWLTAQPPNMLDAVRYRRLLQTMAKQQGWQFEFYTERKLAGLGAGAFLAVAQGNAARDAGIVRLRYRPTGTARTAKAHLALVGKGIIFDTGGNNLKPFRAMLDMHHDMAGSAVAVATLRALSELEYPEPVDCWLAITENRVGSTAYKSRDVVTACNGVSIEVIHTDAEGRMALADTLALAGRQRPVTILDFATLTGSCVSALTERYSGVLTNRDDLHATLIQAGRTAGERVWPFPLDDDFDEDIKSTVADVLQCAVDGSGDHIHAARFLKRFVPADSTWVHVDLSAAHRKGGLAQVPGAVTGFGARLALQLILDNGRELLRRPVKGAA